MGVKAPVGSVPPGPCFIRRLRTGVGGTLATEVLYQTEPTADSSAPA